MRALWCCAVVAVLSACPAPQEWQLVAGDLDEALMSVGGSGENDVWAVGADVGRGPLVLHFDGTKWERRVTGTTGPLWWVHAFNDGTALMGGARGTIVEWNGEAFVRHTTPGLARQTVFGIWASAKDDAWAVGSETSGRRGFLWHFDGATWSEVELPEGTPLRNGERPGLFKVWGSARDDVWVVGGDGTVLHRTVDGWSRVVISRSDTLFTVHGKGARVFLVGGGTQAALYESTAPGFADRSPEELGLIQGVSAHPRDPAVAYASGEGGVVLQRSRAGWSRVDTGLSLSVESLHAIWVDPSGGVWSVGGNVLGDLKKGALIRLGPSNAPTYTPEAPPQPPEPVCPANAIDPAEGKSIARRWNEQILGAIRRDLPRPTVHARNLFHLSAAMWDAWVAYLPTGQGKGVFVDARVTPSDLEADRTKAISYAVLRVLEHRYGTAVGGPTSKVCFRAFMTKLGYDANDTSTQGDAPSAVGNRIAAAIITAGETDGANEQNNYADTTGYMASGAPLTVESPSEPVENIDLWQPLDLAIAATQNGIPLAPGVQKYIGAHWGLVTPFALTRSAPDALYIDPGAGPKLTPATMEWVITMIRRSSELGVDEADTIDISPGGYGNNSLGANDGAGHPMNPVTGQPYVAQRVPRGDFGRVLAEVWADGPKSETPPGHWNVLANQAFAHASFSRKWNGTGAELSPLEWDLRAYLVMNGALHDAAISAWEIKRHYLSSRPITLIRSCGARGQASDPSLPAYDTRGLPLIPGLIELATYDTTAPGGRHAGLRHAVNQVVVHSWKGEPGDIGRVSGTGWLRAVEWVPYQKRDFVTPAFPGYVSGHSTFSRSAAEVLTAITGSAYFPGGLAEQPIAVGSALTFERGPSVPLTLQWATYYDAADQAGQSRIWGGIHIEADDFDGRRTGAQVGARALAHAAQFWP